MPENFYFTRPQDNIAPISVVSSGVAINPGYPLACAVDMSYANLAKPSKLLGTSGDWIGDLGLIRRVDGAVIWHNFDEGLAVHFQMHSSNSWGGTPTIDVPLVIPERRVDGYTQKIFVDLRGEPGYNLTGLRWWRVNVAGVNSAPVGLKIMLLSRIRQLERDFLLEPGPVNVENQFNVLMTTDAGHPWAYDLTSAPRQLRGDAVLLESDWVQVRDWFRAAAGQVGIFAVLPNPDNTDAWITRFSTGSIAQDPGIQVVSMGNAKKENGLNVSIILDEITAGDPEWF